VLPMVGSAKGVSNMLNRSILIAVLGLGIVSGTAFCRAANVPAQRPAVRALDDDDKGDKDDDKNEQKVAVDQLPQGVVDTAKKEVPDGTITEAELEQKHDKKVYELEVKTSDTVYELKADENGKFISKKVDDDDDDKKN
jgi:uncharacterized membrane protein YkoI